MKQPAAQTQRPVTQNFTYDGLYRLTQASGSWRFEPNKRSEYSLTMAYNSIHNITKKTQSHDVVTPGGATVPQKKTSYDVAYTYGAAQPHAPSKIAGSEFLHHGGRNFHYDANGNQLGWDALKSAQKRSIVWDEENRIRSVSDNGRTTTYKYNDAGERVIKRGEQGETAYVNQFFTVRNRSVGTKHVFVGETRLVSKLVPGDAHVNPGNNLFGNTLGQWWWHRSPNGHLHGQNINKNPHYAGNVMPQKLPEDNFVYFYHPDHVGSTSYVTDYDGALYEHVQYFPFGETWVSEQSNTERLPYLFTSKELDEETQLYYFGARYYDPRTSLWQSTDPMLLGVLAGSGGGLDLRGGPTPAQLSVYSYGAQSPVVMVDPDGFEPHRPIILPGMPCPAEECRVLGKDVILLPIPSIFGGGTTVALQRGVQSVAARAREIVAGSAAAKKAEETPAGKRVQQQIVNNAQRAADAVKQVAQPVVKKVTQTPTQRAAERASGALKEMLRPNGNLVGDVERGNPQIRTIRSETAQGFFKRLVQETGALVERGRSGHQVAKIPGGGFAQLRPASRSGAPTIDLNIKGIDVKKLKFE